VKFTTWNAAPDGERIDPHAFDGNVGKTLQVKDASGGTLFEALVTAVEVTEHPHGVSFTFESETTPLWVMVDGPATIIADDELDPS
jgi:hypothetical protein